MELAMVIGLYLVFVGLVYLGSVLLKLVHTIQDVGDSVADNIVLDNRGWPVIATDRPEWGDEDGQPVSDE